MENRKKTADVSMIVPNYNNGKFLDEFILSVVGSTVLPRELIIVDDGSTDNSIQVLKNYKDLEFLTVIYFEKNLGLTAALNAAIDAATGKYIMRADPDDILFSDRIERQLEFMDKNPDIDVLGCNVLYFDSQTKKDINISNFPLAHPEIELTYRRGEHGIQHPTAFIKGEVYRKYRYQKTFPGEDYEILARMVRDGYRFANLPEPLYHMRVHTASSTGNLKIVHIRNTFNFRDEIFGTKTGKLHVFLYYQYILNYRKYQMGKGGVFRYLYLMVSVIAYPGKLFKRINRA
jgi:glycosyltransferase involved in cell wall biosynthesis